MRSEDLNKMPEVTIAVWCSCGAGLCGQAKGGTGDITVDPCEKCLEEARDEGDDEGYQRGYDEGLEEAADS